MRVGDSRQAGLTAAAIGQLVQLQGTGVVRKREAEALPSTLHDVHAPGVAASGTAFGVPRLEKRTAVILLGRGAGGAGDEGEGRDECCRETHLAASAG